MSKSSYSQFIPLFPCVPPHFSFPLAFLFKDTLFSYFCLLSEIQLILPLFWKFFYLIDFLHLRNLLVDFKELYSSNYVPKKNILYCWSFLLSHFWMFPLFRFHFVLLSLFVVLPRRDKTFLFLNCLWFVGRVILRQNVRDFSFYSRKMFFYFGPLIGSFLWILFSSFPLEYLNSHFCDFPKFASSFFCGTRWITTPYPHLDRLIYLNITF